jgi:hypothetical protein
MATSRPFRWFLFVGFFKRFAFSRSTFVTLSPSLQLGDAAFASPKVGHICILFYREIPRLVAIDVLG